MDNDDVCCDTPVPVKAALPGSSGQATVDATGIPASVVNVSLNESHKAKVMATGQINTVAETQKWMSLAVCVLPDGRIELHKTTYQFPLSAMPDSLRLIKEAIAKDIGLDVSPLPVAPGFDTVGDDA